MIRFLVRSVSSRSAVQCAFAAVAGMLCLSGPLQAALKLGTTFGDQMVLQRGQDVTVWGEADPGAAVEVQLADESSSVVADTSGHWKISMKPLAVGGPYTARVTSGSDSISLKDILCGDVWLCAGQSNMQLGVGEDVAAAEMESQARKLRTLRLLSIPKFGADKPDYLVDAKWETTDSPVVQHFSAVAMHLGLALAADPKLAGVPIGLIDSSFGGTAAEGWVPTSALGDFKKSDFAVSMFNLAPGALYNNMIAPLGPLSLTGVVWYQGENNSAKAQLYPRIMHSLISEWRRQFHREDLPFIIVQLPPFVDLYAGYPFTWIREAQSQIAKDNPETGLVVSIDTTDGFNLHPRDKGEIGRRAALQARRLAYHEQVIADGPTFVSMSEQGASLRVTMNTHGGSLVAHGTSNVQGFSIAGEDQIYHFADAVIQSDNSVIVHCADVPEPKSVRYAWGAVPVCNLYNQSGLPAGPFRTDNSPPEVPVEIKGMIPSRHLATSLYDVVVSGTGDLISLGVVKQQFISNNLDGNGTANFPGFFGPRQLQTATLLTPAAICYSDSGVSATYAFSIDSMTIKIQNLSKSSKDHVDYRLHLASEVHITPEGDGFDLARGGAQLHLSGADSVTNDANGSNVLVGINGNSTKGLVFRFAKQQ